MKHCSRCGEHYLPSWSHKCGDPWLVWDEASEGEEDATRVWAVDATSAAEKYADGLCTADGVDPVTVCVVSVGNPAARFRFVVTPEFDINWTAHDAPAEGGQR